MKIAIIFGDNDFHSTFRGVLRTLLDAYNYRLGSHHELPLDKSSLLRIINESSIGHYLSYQLNTWPTLGLKANPPEQDWINHIEHIRKWLHINEEKLLINEEVDEYLKNVDAENLNASTFILNTDLDHENNEPIYLI